MYQQINLADHTMVGAPGALPANLIGLSDAVLADLGASINPPPVGFAGQGFWPVVVTTLSYDPVRQAVVAPTAFTVDATNHAVTGTATIRSMSVVEFIAANPALKTISRRQFFQQLAIATLISQAEAIAAVASGVIPSAMQTIVNSLPGNQQFAVTMLLAGAQNFDLDNPFVGIFAAQYPTTDIIALWQAASAL